MRLGFMTAAKEIVDIVDLHTANTNLQPRFVPLSTIPLAKVVPDSCFPLQFHHTGYCTGASQALGV